VSPRRKRHKRNIRTPEWKPDNNTQTITPPIVRAIELAMQNEPTRIPPARQAQAQTSLSSLSTSIEKKKKKNTQAKES
jgi:hypothetical protein